MHLCIKIELNIHEKIEKYANIFLYFNYLMKIEEGAYKYT